jgi:hypothetical protein
MKISQNFYFSSSKRQKKKKIGKKKRTLSTLLSSPKRRGRVASRCARQGERERERERKREEETPEELRFCVPSSILSFVVVVLKYIETTTTNAGGFERTQKKSDEFVLDAQREQKQGG